jgi:TPP-dependent indolepyruvate ferredoxin oxidoreductase alpha subunit
MDIQLNRTWRRGRRRVSFVRDAGSTHGPTARLSIEGVASAIGIDSVTVIDPYADPEGFESLLRERLAAPELSVIVARRPCILAAADIRRYERQAADLRAAAAASPEQAAFDMPLSTD